MIEQIAHYVVTVAYVYLACGALFSIAFMVHGVSRIDHEAKDSAFAFRVMIAPGVIALWPLLARRWASGDSKSPIQKDPHR